ncbi:MAG: hypothetical protein JWQ27_690 [Ferruginibacter sp.]|nr:hypothetical protein [Ferruginibacter sp.]
MIKFRHVIFLGVLHFFSCVSPKQPPVSVREKDFIDSIEKAFDGSAKREISAALLGPGKEAEKKGSYGIHLLLPCDKLLELSRDSPNIQKRSYFIAKHLYNGILAKDGSYASIWISFSCDTSSSLYRDLVFRYEVDSLDSKN